MENLPKDIISEIGNLLDLSDLLNLALTCHKHYDYIFKNENFWYRRSKKDFSVCVKKEKYREICNEILENKITIKSYYISKCFSLFCDMPSLIPFPYENENEENINNYFFITVDKNLSLDEISLYNNLCNKMNHFGPISEEEINIVKNIIYKSIDLTDIDMENKRLINTIKQYVYLNLLPLPTTSYDLTKVSLFFRD